jgi:Flp pilus assembly protein TadB
MDQRAKDEARNKLALPVGWTGFVAVAAGAACVAMAILTLAGGHMIAAIILAVAAVLLFGWAFVAYRATDSLKDNHMTELKSRRDRVRYRARYPRKNR